ncbi:hypothetical protein NDU88_000210 [Pleurodeles waltl]|uniref:Uncharacterized protein n=1 Tax=Pleurodeles waltl TaxID=8319 RepID=A0AAV7Q2L7_PLEWA|nr:hypothetical protein NDU88_000210 [Pleurodeles waltl]
MLGLVYAEVKVPVDGTAVDGTAIDNDFDDVVISFFIDEGVIVGVTDAITSKTGVICIEDLHVDSWNVFNNGTLKRVIGTDEEEEVFL